MPWLQLKLASTPDAAQRLSDILSDAGALAVTLQDAADQPLYEPPPGATPLWSQTWVTGLFDADADLQAVLACLRSALGGHDLPHVISPLEDKDWEREWMDNYHPMRFGTRLWICPSWHQPPDVNAITVMLDPGLAFGTGTHPTTALCLEWLDAHDVVGKHIIDYGCGSGILAVAAAKLGAQQVWAVDYDPQALHATTLNAEKNAVSTLIHTVLPDDLPRGWKIAPGCSRASMRSQHLGILPGAFPALPLCRDARVSPEAGCRKRPPSMAVEPTDIMLANILAGPLIELAPLFAELVRPGGAIVLSGILNTQSDTVMQRYQPWFDMAPAIERDEWMRLSGVRKDNDL